MPVYAEPEMSSPAACLPLHNLPMQTHSSPTQTERLAVHTHAQQPQPHDTQLLGHAPQPHTHGSPPHTHAPLAHASTTLGLLDSTSAATITPASPAQPAVLAPALDADMGTAPTPPSTHCSPLHATPPATTVIDPTPTTHAPPTSTDGKRKRAHLVSPPPSPPALAPLDQVASQLTTLLSSITATVSDLQSDVDDSAPLTRRQACSLLDALTTSLSTILATVLTLSQVPAPSLSQVPAPSTSPIPPAPPQATPVPPPTNSEVPELSQSEPPATSTHRTRQTPPIPPSPPAPAAMPPSRWGLSYADRLRGQHQAADGESRRRLAGRILVAPPPMQRRLVPLTREPQARLSVELTRVRVVYVRGLLRMPFREMRGYLHELSPLLMPRAILSISYLGPITAFTCVDEAIASTLVKVITEAGGRVDPAFCPWLPLRRDAQDDAEAKRRAEEAFCRRIAGEITTTPNLLLATFLQRVVAPHLAPRIHALVRGSSAGIARTAPQVPHPIRLASDSHPTHPAATTTTLPAAAFAPVFATQPTPAAPAVSTSAPASGVVAEGTA